MLFLGASTEPERPLLKLLFVDTGYMTRSIWLSRGPHGKLRSGRYSLSGPLKYFFSKDWSKNRYFLDFKRLISKTDSATRNFRPVAIFWCSLQKLKKFARLRRPARVGSVTLPTPSHFLRHIWALPQTWSLPGDRYRLEISGPAFTSWKCWTPDPNLSFFPSNLRKKYLRGPPSVV